MKGERDSGLENIFTMIVEVWYHFSNCTFTALIHTLRCFCKWELTSISLQKVGTMQLHYISVHNLESYRI